ncbi:DUF4862 family protein [Agromyces sp. NPDC058484]|uniref:DUF4862 family protein n=1 Tax=Agromyces sp. NPDC058484 TaxID=3346524 RepID=UPI0036658AFB
MHDSNPRRYVVGAYAASPAHRQWNPELEAAFLGALGGMPRVGALELPWLGRLHPHDDVWLLQNLPSSLGAVMTDIGHTVGRTSEAPAFGLASRDDDARAEAIATLERLRGDVHRLNDHSARRVVEVVELHSAPRARFGSAAALAASLEEASRWDWDGAALVVEHCDAEVPGHEPEKGYLPLEDEIGAVRAAGAPVGIAINWGRSAIELRDGDRVTEHIRLAASEGLLRGLMFSGASGEEGAFGRPWLDAHHPFARSGPHPFGDPVSLLTEQRVADALRAAGAVDWLGVKVGWAGDDGTVSDRVTMIAQALDALDRQAAAA